MALQHATASRSGIIESVKCGFGHHHSRQEAISYQRASTRVLRFSIIVHSLSSHLKSVGRISRLRVVWRSLASKPDVAGDF